MTNDPSKSEIVEELFLLIAPFNPRGIELSVNTEFVDDLGLDSLAVMELVASVEDAFGITLPLNLLPEIHSIDDLADTVTTIRKRTHG